MVKCEEKWIEPYTGLPGTMIRSGYILLTAAKNEEAYIGEALESVLRQTVHPQAWFIMDDGSTDRTAEIVRRFADQNPFIRLHSAGSGSGRNFGSQYAAIRAAYELARQLDFEFVGVHDADIAPERNDYYESILNKLRNDPKLGIAGGYIHERKGGVWQCRSGNSEDSVAGAIQMFRRSCFEQIGGYIPLELGGSDWLAQVDARAAGWGVVADPQFPVLHYRPSASANGRWRGLFRTGLMDASFGSHPVFEIFKCLRRIGGRPPVIGSVVRFSGYIWWNLTKRKPLIRPEQAASLRREQLAKLRKLIWPIGVAPKTQL
jgi:poly-beta-1,6-N-acetyl-D-glucosamine synthase